MSRNSISSKNKKHKLTFLYSWKLIWEHVILKPRYISQVYTAECSSRLFCLDYLLSGNLMKALRLFTNVALNREFDVKIKTLSISKKPYSSLNRPLEGHHSNCL